MARMAKTFKQSAKSCYSWALSDSMRLYLDKLSTLEGDCQISKILYQAICEYGKRKHGLSFHEFARVNKYTSTEELTHQLTLERQHAAGLKSRIGILQKELREAGING